MTQIIPTAHGTMNELLLAVNLYISTGDHVGEGQAFEEGDRLVVGIPYDPANPTDANDFRVFASRISELGAAGFNTALQEQTEGVAGSRFRLFELRLPIGTERKVAAQLIRSGGAAGFGSTEPVIRQMLATELAKIATEEGV